MRDHIVYVAKWRESFPPPSGRIAQDERVLSNSAVPMSGVRRADGQVLGTYVLRVAEQ